MYSNLLKSIVLLQEQESPLVFKIVIIVLIVITAFMVLLVGFVVIRGFFNFFEMAQVEYFTKKQFYTNFYLKRNKLPEIYKSILKSEFNFYKKLNSLEKKNFEHRLHYYLKHWDFIGKEIEITNTMKVLIAATAAKLTFGFRHFRIDTIDKVVIYPEVYFSSINDQWHKGEFNLAYKALVFSWEDFKIGYDIEDDNINLGVHECIHAMHFSFIKTRKYSTSSAIFLDSFHELTTMLDANNELKQKLISTGYFREYAFENQFEFISVLVENFIETPSEFRSQFPNIYAKVKEMLNFNFAGY